MMTVTPPAITVRRDYRDNAGNWHVRWRIQTDGRTMVGEAACDPSMGRTIIADGAPPMKRELLVALKRAIAAECRSEVGQSTDGRDSGTSS